MIIVPNDSSSSDTEKRAPISKPSTPPTSPFVAVTTHDPPPSYLVAERLSTATSGASGSNPNRLRTIPNNIKPSNFVSLSRANGSIKGSWLIDPSLSIPSAFLPPLHPTETETARRNLFLESKNGTIDADVFLPSTSYSNTSKFILIHTQSTNGSVKTRLHDTQSPTGEVRLPVRLSTSSSNGAIQVQLPRSFRGPIRIRTHNGGTTFSAALRAHLTPFSELDHVQRSFLGHFNPSQWDMGAPWEGDELSIEAKNGSVKVSFDDETQTSHLGQSFFSRIFSL